MSMTRFRGAAAPQISSVIRDANSDRHELVRIPKFDANCHQTLIAAGPADRTKLYVCSLHDPGMFARWVMLRHACIALPPKEFDVKKSAVADRPARSAR